MSFELDYKKGSLSWIIKKEVINYRYLKYDEDLIPLQISELHII